jgi:uncharacterized protein YndB with AHSA1/START domain
MAKKWILRILAVLVALPLLAAAVLLAIGQRSNAGHSHASVEIHAAPERIFPWLEDSARLKQWVSWLVEVRDDPASHGPGSRRVFVMRDENNGGALMEIPFTFTEYTPPLRLTA